MSCRPCRDDERDELLAIVNAAAEAYRGYLQAYPNSPNAYELQYNLADALFWSENYVTLLPGESRTLEGRYYKADAAQGRPSVRVHGWNVAPRVIATN